MIKNLTLLVLIFLSLCSFGKDLPLDKSLIHGQLKNGFRYTIKKNYLPHDTAEFRLVVKVGSLEEDNDQQGVAHFVEHMAFNGTKNFKGNDVVEFLESIGVTFGSDLNASTSYENTIYKLSVPIEKDNLQQSFQIFEDWSSNITFSEEEFEKERGVILEEIRKNNNYKQRLRKQAEPAFLSGTAFLDRAPLGKEDIIKKISVERAKDYYHDWYRPEFMHFIAVGDFDLEIIEQKIKKHFSQLRNKSTRKRTSRLIPNYDKTEVLSLHDDELTYNYVHVFYNEQFDPTETVKDVRRNLVDEMLLSLIKLKMKVYLEDRQDTLFMGLKDVYISMAKGDYGFTADYKKDGRKALYDLYHLLWSLEKHGFSTDDLIQARTIMHSANDRGIRKLTPLKSKSSILKLTYKAKRELLFIDEHRKLKIKNNLIDEVTLVEIQKALSRILSIKDQVITVIDSNELKISKTEAIQIQDKAKTNATDLSQLGSYKLPQTLVSTELEVKAIVEESYDKNTEVHTFILENGITVNYKKTGFRSEPFLLRASSFGGSSLYDVNDLIQIKKIKTFIARSGAGKYTIDELNRNLSGKKIGVYFGVGYLGESVKAWGQNKDVEKIFQLLFLRLTEPKIEKSVKNKQIALLKNAVVQGNKKPYTRYRKERDQFFFNNKRVFSDSIETIEKLDFKRMLEIFKDRFSDMNNFNFVLVGNVDVKIVKQLIGKYLGNLPIKKRDETYLDRNIEYKKGKQELIRYYNSRDTTDIRFTYKSKTSYSTLNKLHLVALRDILLTRLRNKLREEKSATYDVNVRYSLAFLPEIDSKIEIIFKCAPNNSQDLISEVYKIIEDIKDHGVNSGELRSFKKKYLVWLSKAIKRNSYWLHRLNENISYDIPLDTVMNLSEHTKELTPSHVQDMATQMFREDVFLQVLHPQSFIDNKTTKN